MEKGKIISYADDTAVIFRGGTWEELQGQAIIGLPKIKACLDTLTLTLDIKKSKYIALSAMQKNLPTNRRYYYRN